MFLGANMKSEKIEEGKILKFEAMKSFKYIKELGSGGTGSTHLFKDETTDMLFAIKKYEPVPQNIDFKEELYNRFVDEIKILFKISHPNIVRIYDYYLYPNQKVGYLQMEYVNGTAINKYDPLPWDRSWEEIFIETIKTFKYLEENNILHRDIRPENLLLDEKCNLKVIDFGFGKIMNDCNLEEKPKNSVLLNWPVTEMPEEIQKAQDYDNKTEIYFVGKLFSHIFKDKNIDFKYKAIIEKMIQYTYEQRYNSFNDIYIDISKGIFSEIDFSDYEKEVYRDFAYALYSHIIIFNYSCELKEDIEQIINQLGNVIKENSLELYIQSNSKLINCFVSSPYRYNTSKDIEVNVVKKFYEFFIELPYEKQKNVLDNIHNRLNTIKIEINDDLPF